MTASAAAAQKPVAAFGGAQKLRTIARADDWSISVVDCTAGPDDRPFEEGHKRFSIAAVLSGSFQYRTDAGRALLYPGAFMLGNAGACYECGHEHSTGDACVAFHFAPALFQEIAATRAGGARYRFGAAALPATADLAPAAAEIAALAEGARNLAGGELALRLAARVIGLASGGETRHARASAQDEKRIARTLRHIERRVADALDLDQLASIAAMSKYHFLRTFRNVTGMTPYQHVLGLRLRAAALSLKRTNEPVATIAYAAGFGDLSTFNNRFRAVFGTTPTAWRGR